MLKKIIRWPLITLNVILCIGFLFSGYSYVIPPMEHPTLALANFLFPFFAICVFLFMAFWLFCKKRYTLISLVTLIAGYIPMNKYAPITPQEDRTPENSLKIISYNVHGFHTPDVENDTATFGKLIEYLVEVDADIVCLQEAYLNGDKKERLMSVFNNVETIQNDSLGIAVTCLSKTPIVKVEPIEYESEGNLSACFYVKYEGKLLRIMNNHLESVKFLPTDKEKFKGYVKGALEDDESMEGSKRIVDYIRKAAKERQPQAEALAELIGDGAKNTIVAGDFNDTPLSYCHYLIDQKLTDCYAKRGLFPGFSYTNNGMYVRIDHTFCSDDFEVAKCYVDNSVDYSDHYPIITHLIRAKK